MKLFCKKKEPATYDEKYLVEEINLTKAALSAAYANFDNATDPDLIDCYIYISLTPSRNAINTFSRRLKNLKYIHIFQMSDVYIYGVSYIYYMLTILSIFFLVF